MTDVDSRRIALLRFPLILLIVYLHCYIAPVTLAGGTVSVSPSLAIMALSTGLTNGVARIAVPGLFLLSGYLYFFSFDGSWGQYRRKLSQRFFTLAIPFAFWNILVAGVLLVAQSIPATAAFFNSGNGRLADLDWLGWLNALVGVTRAPIDYQFWFIRDLIIIVIGAPAIWQLIRFGGWLPPILCIIWWIWGLPFFDVPSLEAVTFFMVGAYAGQRQRSLFIGDRIWPAVGALYFVLLAIEVHQSLPMGAPFGLLHRVTLLFGLVLALSLTGVAIRSAVVARILLSLSGASFFVFATHEPTLTVLRKILYRALRPSQIMILGTYLILPLIIVGLSLSSYFLLARFAPRLTAIITGGRVADVSRPAGGMV